MSGIVVPIFRVDYKTELAPIYFNGPVEGAPDWQAEAARIILPKPGFMIISPRPGAPEDLKQDILEGRGDSFLSFSQWTRHYMDLAQTNGACMFWFPEEITREHENPYASRSMAHLGLVLGRNKYDKGNNVKYCIGIHPKFSHADFVRELVDEHDRNKLIHSTLEETCVDGMGIAKTD